MKHHLFKPLWILPFMHGVRQRVWNLSDFDWMRGHGLCPQEPGRSTVPSISAPRPGPHHGGPQDALVIRTSHPIGRLPSHQADRRGEITPFPLQHLGSILKTHSRYFQWSPGDYAMLSVHTISNIPQATILWHGFWSRYARWTQPQAGLESVFPLWHPVTTNVASKIPMTRMKIICSFWWCIRVYLQSQID